MFKLMLLLLAVIGLIVLGLVGAYWWSNVPPGRPANVSADAVFLWAGHLGLPAPKHGTWIECWRNEAAVTNNCRLTEMDGTRSYDGDFVPSDGKPAVQRMELQIEAEPTSDTTNWVRINGILGAPLVFLKNGTVLIPKDAYAEGTAKLEHLREARAMK